MRAAYAPLCSVALAVSVACAQTAQGPLAGASDAWASAPEPTSSPSAKPAQREVDGYGELLRMPTVTAQPFATRGHLPQQSVDVRVNDVARAHYAALVTDTVFPDGSVLAELPHDGRGNGLVMRKNAGNWSFLAIDPRGAVAISDTNTWCVGCHAQAPSDHVFGLPRAP